MIKNDRIITCNWSDTGGFFEYDLSYLHPDVGVLVQEYRISSMNYKGKEFTKAIFLYLPQILRSQATFPTCRKKLKEVYGM